MIGAMAVHDFNKGLDEWKSVYRDHVAAVGHEVGVERSQ